MALSRGPKDRLRIVMNTRHVILPLLLAVVASAARAQLVTPTPPCAVVNENATYRTPPLSYPMTSDRYAVQYKLGNSATWTDAQVYISYYGGTNSSPRVKASDYPPDTSMSFTSIPASANTAVALRVTKLWGSAFPTINNVSIRPRAKGVHVDSASGSVVGISTTTAADFAGDQFILWWDGDTQQNSGIQGLVFFLNPPYNKPTGSNVKIITAPADLTGDLSNVDTLVFQGMVVIGTTGAQAFNVPANISNIFLAPGAWVQGKLHFVQSGAGHMRKVYGPGVLDVSRFEYDLRVCDSASGYGDEGLFALTWDSPASSSTADRFLLDGIVVADHNHAAIDLLVNSTVNNMKLISWNGLNGGFRFGKNTGVSNIFVRAGDDSLMVWGSSVTITNATVWQNYNGGVLNLGWSDNSPGDRCLIDGVYVVRADWNSPTNPSWTTTKLNGQNNAVITSLMAPGTAFGSQQPSLFRNIYVEDPPRVLLSLKILPPDCNLAGQPGSCKFVDLTLPSVLNLAIENLFTPASIEDNSIGFQTLPPGYTQSTQTFPTGYTMTGTMNIGLLNVVVTLADGTVKTLTNANAAVVGKVVTNGAGVNLEYPGRRRAVHPK